MNRDLDKKQGLCSLLNSHLSKGKASYQIQITKANKEGKTQKKQLNVGTNLNKITSSTNAMHDVQNLKEIDILFPKENRHLKISNVSIEFEPKYLKKVSDFSQQQDLSKISSDMSDKRSDAHYLKNYLNFFENPPQSSTITKDQFKQIKASSKISFKIKLNAERKIIEKKQCFQQNGSEHFILLDISDNESSLRNIKDYLNLLSNIQRWEVENEKILQDNLQYLDIMSLDYKKSSFRHIGNVFEDKLLNEETVGERQSQKHIKKETEMHEQIDIPLNILNPKDSNSFEHENLCELEEIDIEINPISNYDINEFIGKFETSSPDQRPLNKSKKSVLNHSNGSAGTIRVFNKDNVEQFEWFVDNVFALSDAGMGNSVIDEKTTDDTTAHHKKKSHGNDHHNGFKNLEAKFKKNESLFPLDAQKDFDIDSLYDDQIKFQKSFIGVSKKNIDIENQSFMKKVENFFSTYFCLPFKKDTKSEFKNDEI